MTEATRSLQELEDKTTELRTQTKIFPENYPAENVPGCYSSARIEFTLNQVRTALYSPGVSLLKILEVAPERRDVVRFESVPQGDLAEALVTGSVAGVLYISGSNTTAEVPEFWKFFSTDAESVEREPLGELHEKLEGLLRNAETDLDDHENSEFESDLKRIILRYGKKVIHQLDQILNNNSLHPEILFDMLRFLGRISYPRLHSTIKQLLQGQLMNSSRWVRDGAALGLASLGDVSALPALRAAVEREEINDLQSDLQNVVNYLETVEE